MCEWWSFRGGIKKYNFAFSYGSQLHKNLINSAKRPV